MTHVLDRPVWTALSTRHSQFALGNDRARRFALDKRSLDRQARLK